MHHADSPPGWSYNPSSWGQRLPLVGLATTGFLIAGYLGLFRFGVVGRVWDAVFGAGSDVVLTSLVAKPPSGTSASRTPPSGRSDTWPTPSPGWSGPPAGGGRCRGLTAFISVVMIGPAMDEVLASLRNVRAEGRARRGGWRAFWVRSADPAGAVAAAVRG